MTFGPFGSFWGYFLGWVGVLAAAAGVSRLAHRRGWASRRPSPGRLLRALPTLRPESPLLDPRWARARLAAVGFLVCAAIAGVMGWSAAQEYRTLAELRDQGHRTDATVVGITSRSEEGRATAVTVRFGTAAGSVRADVDVSLSSAIGSEPGARIPVSYNPADPTEVVHVDYLDGRDADGVRQGSIVIGLLAAGLLAGAAREAVRAQRQTAAASGSASASGSAGKGPGSLHACD
nr:DUF3592 domain-containing protein [Streptomyces sp. AS58]